jgi:hypothetical protein
MVGLADARAAHAAARAELHRDIDPMAERKAEKSAELESKRRAHAQANADAGNPFREVAARWFEKWKEGKVERYARDTESRIQEDVLSSIGNRPIAAIKPAEIAKMILAIEERGAADVARRALAEHPTNLPVRNGIWAGRAESCRRLPPCRHPEATHYN